MIATWRGRLDHPYILLVLTTLFWSGNAIAGKLAVGDVPPMALTFLRWTTATLILSVIAAPHLRKDWPVIRARALYLMAMGGIGFGTFNLFLYNALHTTSALNVSIEQSAMPMVILLLGLVAFGERINWWQVLGITLSLLGVAVTVTRGELSSLATLSVNRGDAVMVGGVLVYAGYAVALRLKPAMHWSSFLAVLAASAALTCLPFFLYEMARGIIFQPSLRGLSLILYVGVFPSILAQLFFARGVAAIGAGRAGMFINLVPLFAAVLAIALLGEQVRLFHVTGFMLVMTGIWLGVKGQEVWTR